MTRFSLDTKSEDLVDAFEKYCKSRGGQGKTSRGEDDWKYQVVRCVDGKGKFLFVSQSGRSQRYMEITHGLDKRATRRRQSN